ncbi:WD40 repeat protein [Saccharothrix saharensis]|uniref:WD40 repeat protein n=1 Tax=Saccharothrix saharensis TaxID=571190 RepID=A0A543J4M6_9PSEU|nr:WD40 repeat domain-containing protein [Saccharothrix saharensis]TQM77786.1 WD40 repeat protein [Saccharothrix saharensis]
MDSRFDVHQRVEAAEGSVIFQAGQDQYLVGRDLHLHYADGVHRVRRVDADAAGDECPYPGLVAFGPAQGRWFFGRDRLVAELVGRLDERLREGGPLVVVAPSGAGKSSLLRAGLLPALAAGRLEGSRHWPCLLFTPTARPVPVLAKYLAAVVGTEPERVRAADPEVVVALTREALADRGGTGPARLVVVVDQLEELFTLCEDERERTDFLDLLARLAAPGPDGQPPVALVVYGLRADFYASCADYPHLRAASQDHQLFLGPMSGTELREAVLLPARAVGLDVEPGLVELLLADLGVATSDDPAAGRYEAGRLPLLAHALRATWQQRHGHTLTVAGYRATGGIREAVATTAEGVFTALDDTGREIAEALLPRLVAVGDGETGDTRRRVPRSELAALGRDPEAVAAVVDAFTGSRLLTRDQDTVEITHEALVRAWPRLRDWINSDRAGNLVRQELEQAAAGWDRDHRDPSRLYRGGRLDTARAVASTRDLPPTAALFLAESVRRHHRRVRARRHRFALLTALALIASVTAVVAFRQGDAAREARDAAVEHRDTAVYNQVTAEADHVGYTDASLAVQLDLAAYRMRRSPDQATKLLAAANTVLATSLPAGTDNVRAVAFSPDGQLMATGAENREVRLWRVADPARPTPLGPTLTDLTGVVVSLAFSPDGKVLAGTGNGATQLWSLADPARPVALGRMAGHISTVSSVAFSPDGRTAATSGEDSTVRLWDVTDPAAPTAIGAPLTGHTDSVFEAVFSPDGRTLASVDNDNHLLLWNVADPARPTSLAAPGDGHTGPVLSVAFSPDGRTLATGSQDRTVRLWNVADPAKPAQLGQLTGHTSYIWSLAFSPDGRTLASAGYDHKALLWNVADPAHPAPLGWSLTGHTGPVTAVAFRPDGHTLATGSHDRTVRLWDVPRTLLAGHTGSVEAVALSRGGRTLATTGVDRTVRLWDTSDPAAPEALGTPLTGFGESVTSLAFSPDGRTLAAGSKDHVVRLWDVADPAKPAPLGQLTGHTGYVWTVAFSPDGRVLASGGDEGVVRLWDVATPARATQVSVLTVSAGYRLASLAFSPDGQVLATGGSDNAVRLWNLTNLPPTPWGTTLTGHSGPVWSVAFSPDGRTAASAAEDGAVRLWDVGDPDDFKEAAPALGAHTDNAYAVAFSPDGRTLASAGKDRVLRFWDVTDKAEPRAVGPAVPGHTDAVNAVAFSPDGRFLVTGSSDRTAKLWPLDVDRVIERICAASRNVLTAAQWEKHVGQPDFAPPCP